MLPSIFGEKLFDDFFENPFSLMPVWTGRDPLYGKHGKNLLKTDVRETDASYELDIDLPGYKKDEIRAELENGYLTISATKSANNDEQDKKGKYIRRERYAGTMQRSFYVGEDVTQEDIKAKFEDGILKLSIPKKEAQAVETKKSIAIEG